MKTDMDIIAEQCEAIDIMEGREPRYANSQLTPQDGDVVRWIDNGEEWTVCREDDIEGPSALHHWPDGGWCNVALVRRPNAGSHRQKED